MNVTSSKQFRGGPSGRLSRPLKIKITLLAIICAVVAGTAIRFLDNVHYNGLLQQANNQAVSAQNKLDSEQHDLQFVINNAGTQLNCYDLQSTYARRVCSSHNQTNPNL